MDQEYTKEQQEAAAKVITNLVGFGFFLGVAAYALFQKATSQISQTKRENIRLASKLNRLGASTKLNTILKALKAEEVAKDAEDRMSVAKADLSRAQDQLKAAGVDYDIPTFIRNGGKVVPDEPAAESAEKAEQPAE